MHGANGGVHVVALDRLFDHEVMVRLRRHARQVRHGQDLLLASEFTQAVADLLGDLAADAGVHLVKDRHDVLVGRFEREGQQHSAQLSPAGEGLERPFGLSGIRREENLRLGTIVAAHDEA